MGSESYLSDFNTETAVKLRMPSSINCDDYVNVVSGMVSKGLDDKEENRSNALEIVKLVEPQEISMKEEHKSIEPEVPSVVLEEEQYDFPELSLLRGDCMVNRAEAYMSRMFNDGRDCDGCENSFLISLTLDDGRPFLDADGDLSKQGDGFYCPPLPDIASVISNRGRDGSLSNVEPYKSNLDSCNDNLTSLDDKSKDDNQLFCIQNDSGLPLQSSGKLKEIFQVNSFVSSSELDTTHEKAVEEILGVPHIDHEASCSAQGSTGVPNYCSATEISTSKKLFFTELDIKGRKTSACCSIDNGCCSKEEILPGAIAEFSSLASVRRTNPKRFASLRGNLADEKSIPIMKIQSNRRKYRRKFVASTSRTPVTHKMFSGVNRKIRSSLRKARLSVWGTVESLFTIIKQRDELIKLDSVSNTFRRSGPKKAGQGVNRRKRKTSMKNKQARLFSTKIPLSCQSMHAAQPSLENNIENSMPTSDCHTGTSSTKVELEQNLVEKWYAVVRSNIREVKQEEKDLESTLTQETSSDNLLPECQGVSSQVDVEFVAETVDDEHPSDPSNSPDSDVYNPIMDVGNMTFEGSSIIKRGVTSHKKSQIQQSKEEDGLTSVAPNFIEPFVTHLRLFPRQMHACGDQRRNPMKGHKGKEQTKERKEKKGKMGKKEGKGKREKTGKKIGKNQCPFLISDPSPGDARSDCLPKFTEVNKASLSCSFNCEDACQKGGICSKLSRKQCEIGSDTERLPADSSLCGLACCLKIQKRTGSDKFPLQNGRDEKLEEILPSGYSNEFQVHGNTTEDKTVAVDALLKDATKNVAISVFSESTGEPSNSFSSQCSFSGKKAWALCDDCQKWRCVPDELVHVIEKGRWTCKDNVDQAFADCTIPQEKTDEDINNDLGILDEQYCPTTLHNYGELAPPRLSAAARTTWTPIKSNLFLHRNRRTQTIDEIMVCHCKPSQDGGLGCGEECLNRMLNIECVKGTCPCGNLCSNQQFQKRKYAKFKWLKCGKKGYGLQLEHNVSRGQFLIEYVGEVLDLAAYEARLRFYACRGQKHFYFMTLNGGEVIDACDKGNLGRFINHSCDPNCRTEKWMVNGEVCIGLFAIRDIKKGEEITFDYNYVRVFGAAAKKCVCGSADCRGYIGGDPSSSEVIVQDDSDAEDLEPIMTEGGENELRLIGIDSVATNAEVANHENFPVERNQAHGNPSISEQGPCIENHSLENQDAIQLSSELDLSDSQMQSSCVEFESNVCKLSDIQPFQGVNPGLNIIELDQVFHEDINTVLPPLDAVYRSLPDHTVRGPVVDDATNVSSQNSCSSLHKRSSATCSTEEIFTPSKPNNVVKSLRHIKVKRSRVSIKSVASGKTKKVPTAISSRHIEGVEEKLNELLDDSGGICRKKDAAKGYLKLLVVTAAAGDETKGSMSQSARDLSLILDAILKTKSRMVLVDIINKNGLQMLHNIMKQNRDNFNRIPILRKLLKVLEFLAEKEILTIDHIHAAAPHAGMESFKESMLKLMKHRDTQVHLIARNFADQWIPRNYRRAEPSDKDGRPLCTTFPRSSWCQTPSFHSWHDHGEALSLPTQTVSTSASFTDNTRTEAAKSRKRKTRWDQPHDIDEQASQCTADQAVLCSGSSAKLMRHSQLEPISDTEVPQQKSATQSEGNNPSDEVAGDGDDDEMPPGFGSPCKHEFHQIAGDTDISGEAIVIGHPQERYLAHLTVAYGMPIALVQQTKCSDLFGPSTEIAPAMPFKPFPPLPPYQRQGPFPSTFNGNKLRAGFPKHGNGRRFFHSQHWNNQRPRRF